MRLAEALADLHARQPEHMPEPDCEQAVGWLRFVDESPYLARLLYNMVRLAHPDETLFEASPVSTGN